MARLIPEHAILGALLLVGSAIAQSPPEDADAGPAPLPTQRTAQEALPPVNSAPPPAPVPRWVDGFDQADTDRNGSLSREEFEARGDARAGFAGVDRDGDGRVSRQEWNAQQAASPEDRERE